MEGWYGFLDSERDIKHSSLDLGTQVIKKYHMIWQFLQILSSGRGVYPVIFRIYLLKLL